MQAGQHVTPTIRLVRPLGQGTMGCVWVADHLALGTQVAVKLMARYYVQQPELAERFRREAQAAAQIKSPHVTQVFDHGVTPEGEPFIVMELLDGEALRQRLQRLGHLPIQQVVRLVEQTAKALSRAHQLGIVHRDIKPDNLFLIDVEGEPFVKVLDFGIAKQMQPDVMGMTSTGAMLGTPLYMSPEQFSSSKHIDYRTDLWALSVVAYQALTGRVPFEGDTFLALARSVCAGKFLLPSALRPDLPAAVDAWMARALQCDAAQRFESAMQMAQALEAAAQRKAEPAPSIAFADTERAMRKPDEPVPPAQGKASGKLIRDGTSECARAPGHSGKQASFDNQAIRRVSSHPVAVGTPAAAGAPDLVVSPAVERVKGKPPTAWREPVTGMAFVWVPSGRFLMGSSKEQGAAGFDPGAFDDETPAHEVKLPHGVWMAEHPVTNAHYRAFLADAIQDEKRTEPAFWQNPRFNAAEQPVVGVTFEEALAFCGWLTELVAHREGYCIDLPTEAEWEHAARGSDGRRYPWGNGQPTPDRACFGQPPNTGAPAPVGGRRAGKSPFGCQDMAGNVWEWCLDAWRKGYRHIVRKSVNPCHPGGRAAPRVVRGGSWYYAAGHLRCAIRSGIQPRDRHKDLGFRVVCRTFRQPWLI